MGPPPVNISQALANVQLLGIETAPLIYFIEKHPTYVARMRDVFGYISAGRVEGVTSMVTAPEVLMKPMQTGNVGVQMRYYNLLFRTRYFVTLPIDQPIGLQAADLRARYGLKTPDAIQVATALHAGADALLTNDTGLKRVAEITILILDDLVVG